MDAANPTAISNWLADEVASLKEVARIHHQNFAFFQKLIWPAVLFGAVILQLSMWQSTEIWRTIPKGYGHSLEIFESSAVRFFGFFADFLFYCFAFAGTSAAVQEVLRGNSPDVEESLNVARSNFKQILVMTTVFFFLVLVAFGLALFIGFTVQDLVHARGARSATLNAAYVAMYGTALLSFSVLSRYALAIPALVLENLPFSKSFKRSDRLTEGHMLYLVALIRESVVGGYLTLVAPFWMWNHVFASRVVLTWTIYWILRLIGLAASAAVQPVMFIGFAYLYITESTPKKTEPTPTGIAIWSAKA